MGNFYNVPGVEFIYHGEVSDPEVRYKDRIFNYWDLENALYEMYIEEGNPRIDKPSCDDKQFREWIANDPDTVYNYLDDWIFSIKEAEWKDRNLKGLLNDDEEILHYAFTGHYTWRCCIITKGSDDIAGALEDTLHRILDNGGTKDDVCQIMGAIIPSESEMKELEESEEYVSIDLGYVIPGLIFDDTVDDVCSI